MGIQPKTQRANAKIAGRTRRCRRGRNWVDLQVGGAVAAAVRRRRTIRSRNELATEMLDHTNDCEPVARSPPASAADARKLGRGPPVLFPRLTVQGMPIPHFLDPGLARWLLRGNSQGTSILSQLKFDPHISKVLPHLHKIFPFIVEILKTYGPECFFRLLICLSVRGRRAKVDDREEEIAEMIELAKQRGLLAMVATSASFLLMLKQRGVLGSVMRLVCRQKRLIHYVMARQQAFKCLTTKKEPLLNTHGNEFMLKAPISACRMLSASVQQAMQHLNALLNEPSPK